LLGVALCAAAFLATRSANDTGSAVTTSPPVEQSTPAKPAAKPAKKIENGPQANKSAPAKDKPAAANTHKAAPAATKPATPPAPAKPVTPPVSPQVAKTLPAIKALARGDVVVFFFTHAGPADDTGTRVAMKSVRDMKGVSVFAAGYKDLETFRPVLAGAGVSQVPAIVIVRAGQKGRLVEGYVDNGTLRQTVADARR
jgi:hypothetical protein